MSNLQQTPSHLLRTRKSLGDAALVAIISVVVAIIAYEWSVPDEVGYLILVFLSSGALLLRHSPTARGIIGSFLTSDQLVGVVCTALVIIAATGVLATIGYFSRMVFRHDMVSALKDVVVSMFGVELFGIKSLFSFSVAVFTVWFCFSRINQFQGHSTTHRFSDLNPRIPLAMIFMLALPVILLWCFLFTLFDAISAMFDVILDGFDTLFI